MANEMKSTEDEYIVKATPNLDYLKPRCGANKFNGLNIEKPTVDDIEDLTKRKDERDEFEDLNKIKEVVISVINEKINNRSELNKLLLVKRKVHKKNFSLVELQFGYRILCENNELEFDQTINNLFQKKQFRSQSGVMVVAIFTSPFPNGQKFSCEYDCWYCPEEPNQPRSYLFKEPGVLRANRNDFDCVAQMWDRLKSYHTLGHPTDKLEIIVLGGTWSSYPLDYRHEFIRDMYYAANNYHRKINDESLPEKMDLSTEMRLNQLSKSRVIGLTIETRPDRITPTDLADFRTMGVTRVQIGIQHTNDRILRRINRRCSTYNTIKAIKLLKDCGFKVDIHIMPNLPKPLKEGVSHFKEQFEKEDIDQDVDMIQEDTIMFDKFLFDPDFSADQWKIYPCEVVPWTRLKDEYERGVYLPYAEQEGREMNGLHDLLMDVKSKVPIWVRLNRVIRDIPTEYILGGPKDVSMRQLLETEMKKRGLKCKCIRCREVKKQEIDPNTAELFVTKYEASEGDEYFITFETPDRETLFGFLRLRLSHMAGKYMAGKREQIIFEELLGCAMIRELHVYGQTTAVNRKDDHGKEGIHHQHVGFGTMMVNKAFEIAKCNGYEKISVISGEGVKPYYERFGFKDGKDFMITTIDQLTQDKMLKKTDDSVKTMNNKRVKELNSTFKVYTNMELDEAQIPSDHETETLKVTFNTDTNQRNVYTPNSDNTEIKEPSLDIRSDISNPKAVVSPWFNSTIEPDKVTESNVEDHLIKEKAFEALKQNGNCAWNQVGTNVTDVTTVETISFVKGEGSEEESMSDEENDSSDDEVQPILKQFESQELSDQGKLLIKIMMGIVTVYAIAVPAIIFYNR